MSNVKDRLVVDVMLAADLLDWACPQCGAFEPEVEEIITPGFTGAPIYIGNFKCCGYQDFDDSEDNLEAVR